MITGVIASQDNGSVIRGKVTDMSGKALAGAGVTIEDSFIGVHTDSDGTYVITDLKMENIHYPFRLSVMKPGLRIVNLNGERIFRYFTV